MLQALFGIILVSIPIFVVIYIVGRMTLSD